MPTAIPIRQPTPKPMEFLSAKPFFNGPRGKNFTNTFRYAYLESFGMELTVKNNTQRPQEILIDGILYDSADKKVCEWHLTRKVDASSTKPYHCYVTKEVFATLSNKGQYKFVFWLNKVKVVNGKIITIEPI